MSEVSGSDGPVSQIALRAMREAAETMAQLRESGVFAAGLAEYQKSGAFAGVAAALADYRFPAGAIASISEMLANYPYIEIPPYMMADLYDRLGTTIHAALQGYNFDVVGLGGVAAAALRAAELEALPAPAPAPSLTDMYLDVQDELRETQAALRAAKRRARKAERRAEQLEVEAVEREQRMAEFESLFRGIVFDAILGCEPMADLRPEWFGKN